MNPFRGPVAIDIETTGLDPRTNKMTHIGIYDGENFEMKTINDFHVTDEGGIWPEYHTQIIGHNFKFDSSFFHWNHGYDVLWKYDTMLLSQLYDSRVKHKLDTIGELYVGEGKWGDKKVIQAIKKGEFWMLPQDIQEQYLSRDCSLTYKLFQFFKTNLSSTLWKLYEDFDLPVSHALSDIERNGFTINEALLDAYRILLDTRLNEHRLELQHTFGDINLNSPQKLLDAIRRTTNIQLTNTSERALSVVAKYDKRIAKIFEYRETFKYLNTYIDGEGKNGKRKGLAAHLYNGKVYPQFHLAGDYHTSTGHGTETGRTSSSDPNLQNQPRPESGPCNIRRLFCASDGATLLSFDYNQLELKVCAFLSGEKNLLDGDLHQQAANILKVDRSTAKNINFAKLYNAQRPKIYYMSGGSKYVDKYLKWFEDKFPKAVQWCNKVTREAKESGYVETYLGRRRYIGSPEVGPNSIIQGSAGDIGKAATWAVHKNGNRVLGLVHDEVIVEVPEREVRSAAVDIQRLMTKGLFAHEEITEQVELGVSVKQGKNWGTMEEYNVKD